MGKDKILGVAKDKVINGGTIPTSAGAGVGAVAIATAASGVASNPASDSAPMLGFSYSSSFKTLSAASATAAPAVYEPVLSEIELVTQHALAETMSDSIDAYNSTPIKKKKVDDDDDANKMKAMKATEIDGNLDDFYEKFAPTPTKIKEAAAQLKTLSKPVKNDYNKFRMEAIREGRTPVAVEVIFAEIGGEKRPVTIIYHGAYHIKEVLKGPKGMIRYLNKSLHTLIHDNFVAADYLSGAEKQNICNNTTPDSFDDMVFISQLLTPCNIVFFGAASVKALDYSTDDIIKQSFATKDLIVRKLPELMSPDAESYENEFKKRKFSYKQSNIPKDGRFKVFYKEYTATTAEELNFLRNIKAFLDQRWFERIADHSAEDEEDDK